MFSYDRKSVDMFAGPAREMFEAWISFFPTAPLFGVPWRFAPDFTLLMADAKAPTRTRSMSATRTKPVTKPVLVIDAKAQAAEKPKAEVAEKPKTQAAEKPKAASARATKVAPVAKVEAAPAKEPVKEPAIEPGKEPAIEPSPVNDGGSIEQIRGIGPRLAAELNGMGITTVAQIAALTKAELTRIDAKLSSIKGRCFRDDWVGQAKALISAA